MLLLTSRVLAGRPEPGSLQSGIMHFQGIVITESCQVEAGDRQMTVNMRRISSSNRPHAVGKDIAPTSFDIHLKECAIVVSKHVTFSFQGLADEKNPDILALEKREGVATGIGIALFDKSGNQIPLNAPARSWTRHHTDSTSLHVIAKYRSTANQFTEGVTNAQAWLSLTYQ